MQPEKIHMLEALEKDLREKSFFGRTTATNGKKKMSMSPKHLSSMNKEQWWLWGTVSK